MQGRRELVGGDGGPAGRVAGPLLVPGGCFGAHTRPTHPRGCQRRAPPVSLLQAELSCTRAANPGRRWTPAHPFPHRAPAPPSHWPPSCPRVARGRLWVCLPGRWGSGPDLKEQPPRPLWSDSGLRSDTFHPYPIPLMAGGGGDIEAPGTMPAVLGIHGVQARPPRPAHSGSGQSEGRVLSVCPLFQGPRAWPPSPRHREEEPVGGAAGEGRTC